MATVPTIGWIVDEGGCHIWQGPKNRNGYGYAWDGGRLRVVHRMRYEREVGPIPPGMELDHYVCDNKACCNPAHTRPVTKRENRLRNDGITAQQAAKTHCKHGHEFTPDNLVPSKLQRGIRECKRCRRRSESRRDKARRAVANG